MTPPVYFVPPSVPDATGILAGHPGAQVIAGGTDLVVRLRAGLVRPPALVDIERIPDLQQIVRVDGTLRIGATVTVRALVASLPVHELAPVLAEAGGQMGAVQLRNMATVGGNLASAVPSADLAPPLLVLDALAHIAGPDYTRTLPVEEFFVAPHRCALRNAEILTAVAIPAAAGAEGCGAAFLKFGKRSAQVLAVVNAAAWVRLRGGVIEEARVALGAVAPTPLRARGAEMLLRGQRPDPEIIREGAEAAAAETRPITDMRASAEFRRELSRVLVRRALLRAVQRAGESGGGHVP